MDVCGRRLVVGKTLRRGIEYVPVCPQKTCYQVVPDPFTRSLRHDTAAMGIITLTGVDGRGQLQTAIQVQKVNKTRTRQLRFEFIFRMRSRARSPSPQTLYNMHLQVSASTLVRRKTPLYDAIDTVAAVSSPSPARVRRGTLDGARLIGGFEPLYQVGPSSILSALSDMVQAARASMNLHLLISV